MRDHDLSRRTFLISLGTTVAATSLTATIFESCSPASTADTGTLSGTTITLDLNNTENAPLGTVGGAIKTTDPNDSSRPMIVARISETAAVAYSSRCTHQGCEVSLPEANRITCPCHGSTFDGAGNLISGPATRSLRTYQASLDGAMITVQA